MKKTEFSGFGKDLITLIKKLNTPYKIQNFLDKLEYNFGKRICPVNVIKTNKGDCFEAAVFACAVLEFHNIKCFLIDLRAVRDEDHVLAVYILNNRYGSIAQSKFLGLKYRNPVYKTLRELVMSYFEHFFNSP